MHAHAIIPFPIGEDSTLNQIRAEILALESRLTVLRASAAALARTPEPSPPGAREIRPILVAVANHFGLSVSAIFSRSRIAEVVLARHTCMYLVRERLKWSTTRIGQMFDRDHAAVLNGCAGIADRAAWDRKFSAAMATIVAGLDQKAA